MTVTIDGAASLLGYLEPLYPVSNKTTTGCTVTVKNVGALVLGQGAVVRVLAWSF